MEAKILTSLADDDKLTLDARDFGKELLSCHEYPSGLDAGKSSSLSLLSLNIVYND